MIANISRVNNLTYKKVAVKGTILLKKVYGLFKAFNALISH